MVSRRQLLAATLPGLVAVAGCNGRPSPGATGEGGTDTRAAGATETQGTNTTPTSTDTRPSRPTTEARVPPASTTPEDCDVRTTRTVTPGPDEPLSPPAYPDVPETVTEESAVRFATAYERARRVQDILQRYDMFAVQSVTVETVAVRSRPEHGGVLVTFEARYRAQLSGGERSSATVSDRLLVAYHVSDRGVWWSQADPEDPEDRLEHPLVDGEELLCRPGG